ncbi:MAG: SDR family oxidoreductase [Spirochaetales bacterium]|nr:SDR family oxidoreductase [Spirochaetales bacterium]
MSFCDELFSLKTDIAVITGAGGAIPFRMAETLLLAGARVSLWGRGVHTRMDDVVSGLRDRIQESESVHGLTVDTGDEDAVKKALERTEKEFGRPTILVNGVGGVGGLNPFLQTNMDNFKNVLHNNLLAGCIVPIKVCAALWMAHHIKGSIINIASMASYRPLPGVWAYDAAKAGVIAMTRALAADFAPYGIRVNAIAPGFFLGKQNRHVLIEDEKKGEYTERGKSIIGRTPFGRFGTVEELSGVTLLLASNRASGFMTGTCIPVDGGFLTHSI